MSHQHANYIHVNTGMAARQIWCQQQQLQAGGEHLECAGVSLTMGALDAVILLISTFADDWIYPSPAATDNSLYSNNRSLLLPAMAWMCSSTWRTTPHNAGSLVRMRTRLPAL